MSWVKEVLVENKRTIFIPCTGNDPCWTLCSVIQFNKLDHHKLHEQTITVAFFDTLFSEDGLLDLCRCLTQDVCQIVIFASIGNCLLTSLLCKKVTTMSLFTGRKYSDHSPVQLHHLSPHGDMSLGYLSRNPVAMKSSPRTCRHPLS